MKWINVLMLIFLSAVNASCTGSQFLHGEAPPAKKAQASYLFDKLFVHFPRGADPLAMDLFTRSVISQSIAKEVHQVESPNKETIPYLSVELSVNVDSHTTAKAFKEYALGFSLFLLEPMLWFDVDYGANGSVSLVRPQETLGPFVAVASTTTRAKWFSLDELNSLHEKALQNIINAVIDDLLDQIRRHAGNRVSNIVNAG